MLETSTTLLRQLASDVNHERWAEFIERYSPMMEAFMRERFPSIEAADVIQETFIAISRILPDYEYAPDEKGHFRNYLTGILRNKARQALRRQARQNSLPVDDIDIVSTSREQSNEEERQWKDSLFDVALGRFLSDKSVADRTKRIFERTTLNGESPESVAAAFKMTRHAVDQAKSRAMARLRELVKQLESAADV